MKATDTVLRRVPQPQLTTPSDTSPENVPVGRLGIEKKAKGDLAAKEVPPNKVNATIELIRKAGEFLNPNITVVGVPIK